MTNLSYLIYPATTLQADAAVQNKDRQKKLASEIIIRVADNIKIRNAQDFRSIKVAYTKDYTRGGKALYLSNDRTSPLVSVHMGLFKYDNIVVEEEDKEAIQIMLDSVFMEDFKAKGYKVTKNTVYERKMFTIKHEDSDGVMSQLEVREEFSPVTMYEIEWRVPDGA